MKSLRRRVMRGIRRLQMKRLLVLTFCSFCVIIAFTYVEDCSLLAISSDCQPPFLTVKLNSSFVAFDYTSALNRSGSGSQARAMKLEADLKGEVFVNDLEAFNESMGLRMDPVFEERRENTEKSCAAMLSEALDAEHAERSRNGAKSKSNHVAFSVGATVSPDLETGSGESRARRSRIKTDKKRRLLIMQHNNLTSVGKPRYFQSQMLAFQNRWVHYHRIVKSSRGPKYNQVVEIKWCPVFKAASTPWLAIFTKLSKALTNHTEAAIKRGKMGFLELAKTFRLLTPRRYDKGVHPIRNVMVVVRHPFKRLLSGYKDKIERVKGRLFYYNKYSTKIMQKFRTRKANLSQFERSWKDKDFSLKIPTFQEFVRFILSFQPKKLDEHWRPMFLDCNPCHKKFDFILKVETLNEDMKKMLTYLQLKPTDPLYKEAMDVWKRWNNPSVGNKTSQKNESFYFSQLTKEQMHKLYQIYEPDFRLFGYSPMPYLAMATGDDKSDRKNNATTKSSQQPS